MIEEGDGYANRLAYGTDQGKFLMNEMLATSSAGPVRRKTAKAYTAVLDPSVTLGDDSPVDCVVDETPTHRIAQPDNIVSILATFLLVCFMGLMMLLYCLKYHPHFH